MIGIQAQSGGAVGLGMAKINPGTVGLAWLGQAGFLLRYQNHCLLIDPYLSDYLAQKYRGTYYPHVRMMLAPLVASELHNIDWVLCTHRHSDHMDPGSLGAIAVASPECQFVVPAAECDAAAKAGIPSDRMVLVNAGETLRLGKNDQVQIHVLPAAHEQIRVNSKGEHHFLGYIVQLGPVTFYHSGDCVPFAEQVELLEPWQVDIALLPVNGRDELRRSHGVPGNMNYEEAAELCRQARIPYLIPHHFGMFEFNTVTWEVLRRASILKKDPVCYIPEAHQWYLIHEVGN